MRVDRGDLVHLPAPRGQDPIGVIVRRMSDRRFGTSLERVLRYLLRLAPGQRRGLPTCHRAVAGEGELAAGHSIRPLKDDATNRVRKGRMAQPVEHDLHDGALIDRAGSSLVIGGCGQAVDRPQPIAERRRR